MCVLCNLHVFVDKGSEASLELAHPSCMKYREDARTKENPDNAGKFSVGKGTAVTCPRHFRKMNG